MTKEEVSQRVLYNGKPLSLSEFTWDAYTYTFSSKVNGLVVNFKGFHNYTFETENDCVFCTGCGCVFKTGSGCIFDTVSFCMFNTKKCCIFNTGWNCTFKTKGGCVFNAGWNCTFDTRSCCKFNTGGCCTFNTEDFCTFDTESGCKFNAGRECVVVRRDVFEVIQLKKDVEIELNDTYTKGYAIINPKRTIIFDGKEITLSEESYQEFIKQLKD